ncbi:MAG TPA: TIGR03085 family metal-binding protein [Actinomycetes bacterium]|nr:TIGR03085 family metal-binding protein [Actinomycetes bacterium]
MSSYARTERAELCALLDRVGPEHPTLCAGWSSYDLAAHLVTRERRPDAAIGIVVRQLAGRTRSVQQRMRDRHSFSELITMLRDGPPRWSPIGLPGVDEMANGVEFFVHHEDVRRAGPDWTPRELDPGLVELLWSRLQQGGRLLFRSVDVGVRLHRTDTGTTFAVRPGEPAVVLAGLPAELMLYAFGRRAQADVTVTGDQPAVSRLARAKLRQ